jgi:hypothetical protein
MKYGIVAEAKMYSGGDLVMNTLGNALGNGKPGYMPLITVKFKESLKDTAWNYYCKAFIILLDEKKLKDTDKPYMKEIDFDDCIFHEISDDEVNQFVDKYNAYYNKSR